MGRARVNKPAPLECADTFWYHPTAAHFLLSCKFTEQATLPGDLVATTVCSLLHTHCRLCPRSAFIIHPPFIVHCTTLLAVIKGCSVEQLARFPVKVLCVHLASCHLVMANLKLPWPGTMAMSRKNCSPEKFYPRAKIFSDCVENFCPTLKIFVCLAKSCLPDFSSALHVCPTA